MPKLKSRPPEYKQSGKYAVVYIGGKRVFLGLYGSDKSQQEYARIIAESKSNPTFSLHGERDVTLDEVAIAYLDHAQKRFDRSHYENYQMALKFATDL